MTITGINSNGYTSYYATSHTKTVKKADCEQDSTSTKESNVTISEVTKKVVNSITSSEKGMPLENSYSGFDVKA